MTVHERIATAMQVIAEFDFNKSGQVTGGASYNFIPIGQILQAIRKAHAKAGLFLTIGQLEYDKGNEEGIFDRVINSKPYKQARGHSEVSINGADGDCISFVVPFNVLDNSDKLDNKIVTNIERQAYRVLYAIDEGDASDPETVHMEIEDEHPEAKKPAQQDRFIKTADKPAEARPPEKQISVERARLLKKLSDIILEGGNDGELINKMVADFNKSSLDYCKTEELRDILNTVRPFDNYTKEGKQ